STRLARENWFGAMWGRIHTIVAQRAKVTPITPAPLAVRLPVHQIPGTKLQPIREIANPAKTMHHQTRNAQNQHSSSRCSARHSRCCRTWIRFWLSSTKRPNGPAVRVAHYVGCAASAFLLGRLGSHEGAFLPPPES